MQINLNRRIWDKATAARLPVILAIAGILILALALFGWFNYVRNKPENIFFGMLENNLQTWSVARETSQQAQGRTIDQAVQLLLGHQNIAYGRTDLHQEGSISARVVTENLGTPYEDYISYKEISTSQTDDNGQRTDFSEVTGIWAKNDQQQPEATTGELYSELSLGLIPFADLDQDARKRVLSLIKEKNAYEITSEPQSIRVNSRPVYVYQVELQPEGYVTVLKQIAEESGLTHLEDLDPANFVNAQPIGFNVSVDVWSRQLIGVQYEDGRVERYGSYGVRKSVEVPEESITLQELQTKIENLQ